MGGCRTCDPVPDPFRRAAGVLERRWTLALLWAAHAGAHRFNEFQASVGRVPPATLSQRLAELAELGILERVEVPDARPARLEYHLTDHGRRLGELLVALERWSASTN